MTRIDLDWLKPSVPTGWFSRGALQFYGLVILLVLLSMSACHASCMTKSEARQVYKTSHLYWHGSGHCWDAHRGRTEKTVRVALHIPTPRERPQEAYTAELRDGLERYIQINYPLARLN